MRFVWARGRPGGHPPPPCSRRPARWSAKRRKEESEMQCSMRHASSDAVLPSTPASQSSRLKNSCFSSVAPARRRPSGVSRTSRPATSTSDRDDRPAKALVTLGLVTPRRSAMSALRQNPPARRGSRRSPRGSPPRIRSHRRFRTSSHQPRSFPKKNLLEKQQTHVVDHASEQKRRDYVERRRYDGPLRRVDFGPGSRDACRARHIEREREDEGERLGG